MGTDPAWICLIGPRRAGKSTLAPRLGRALGLPAFDLDAVIEREAGGVRIPTIVAREGWRAFRDQEALALERLLEGPPGVLSCGGGTPLRPDSARRLTAAGTVVYLHIDLEEQLRRARDDREREARPALTGEPFEQEIERLHAERHPVYAGIATATIDAARPIDVVLAACLQSLR